VLLSQLWFHHQHVPEGKSAERSCEGAGRPFLVIQFGLREFVVPGDLSQSPTVQQIGSGIADLESVRRRERPGEPPARITALRAKPVGLGCVQIDNSEELSATGDLMPGNDHEIETQAYIAIAVNTVIKARKRI
jgi:hypothetical protein